MSKKGYWMAMVEVTDPENYPKYIAANKAACDKFGAKFLTRGGQSRCPRCDNQWPIRTFKHRSEGLDRTPIDLAVFRELREVVNKP